MFVECYLTQEQIQNKSEVGLVVYGGANKSFFEYQELAIQFATRLLESGR